MRRHVEQCRSTGRYVHRLTADMTPALAFDRRMSQAAFAAWQQRLRRKLAMVLALPRPESRPTGMLRATEARQGYRLERWRLSPEPGYVCDVLLLIPDGADPTHRRPAVACFPGTDHSKELLAGEPHDPALFHNYPKHPGRERMAWHFVQAGYVAACVDNPGTQSSADPRFPGRSNLCLQLLRVGRSYSSLAVQQARTLYRWLRSLPMVDPQRVAISGHSLGSQWAGMVGVLEPSAAAVLINGHVGSRRDMAVLTDLAQSPIWHVVPGMERWFDFPDLVASLAPRPVLVSEGVTPWHLDRLRRAFALAAAAEALAVNYSPRFARRRKSAPMPVGSMDVDEFKRRSLLDSDYHGFKPDLAVPWLRRLLGAGPTRG